MISKEIEAEILRLYHAEKWRRGTIARNLGVHHSVVSRVIAQEHAPRVTVRRERKIDPFVPFILEQLEKYPRLTATRLYRMVRERGYPGGESHFRALVAEIRPPPRREAFLRLRTLAAEQAQVDWAHFGRLTIGRARRPLMGFVLVLSYSRAVFLRFFLAQDLSNFLRGHQEAFQHFGGTARVILYDNLRSAVIERIDRAIRFNSQLLDFAAHYRFEPRPVNVARGNEKGRVERAIRFARDSFFAARKFHDLADLNRQADEWMQTIAVERRWPQDRRLTVAEALEHERSKLIALPPAEFPCHERVEVALRKTPYVRFDLNHYSVPHQLCPATLVVVATLEQVRILHEGTVVAIHPRSYDRDQQIEDPAHIEALRQEKEGARKHSELQLLGEAAPSSTKLLETLAERGQPLRRAVAELTELACAYGTELLEKAIAEALRADAPHVQAVRHALERDRRQAGEPPARPLVLPKDPRVRGLTVKPHDPAAYDRIYEDKTDANHQDHKS